MTRERSLLPYLAVALVGGVAGYGVHLAAKQIYGPHGGVIVPVVFYLALQMGFAVWWRLRHTPMARATPAVVYAVALTAAAIPCGLLGYVGAMYGQRMGEEVPGQPLIIPFAAEVGGFVIGFFILMIPVTWLLWKAVAQRR